MDMDPSPIQLPKVEKPEDCAENMHVLTSAPPPIPLHPSLVQVCLKSPLAPAQILSQPIPLNTLVLADSITATYRMNAASVAQLKSAFHNGMLSLHAQEMIREMSAIWLHVRTSHALQSANLSATKSFARKRAFRFLRTRSSTHVCGF